jgi:hypothetical protein
MLALRPKQRISLRKYDDHLSLDRVFDHSVYGFDRIGRDGSNGPRGHRQNLSTAVTARIVLIDVVPGKDIVL